MTLFEQIEEKKEAIEAANERVSDEDAKLKGKKQELDQQADEYARELQDQDESLHRVQVSLICDQSESFTEKVGN